MAFPVFRFFRVVPPVPRLTLASFTAVCIGAIVTMMAWPERTAGWLVPLFVLQAFAVSTSFAAPARRGYYDLLFTSGVSRLRIAITHWLVSAMPGVAGWLLIGVADRLLASSSLRAFVSGTVLALVLISTISWALTVSLPRFAGAIGWLLVALVGITLVPAADMEWGSQHSPVPRLIRTLVFPIGTVGHDVRAYPFSAGGALAVAILSMTMAFAWLARRDVPLEAAQ